MNNKGEISFETLEFFGAWIVIILAIICMTYYSERDQKKKEAAERKAYIEAYDEGYEDGYNHYSKDY